MLPAAPPCRHPAPLHPPALFRPPCAPTLIAALSGTRQEMAAGKKPFVLSGAIDEWPALTKWKDLKHFSEHSVFKDSTVDWYPFNLAKADRKPWL